MALLVEKGYVKGRTEPRSLPAVMIRYDTIGEGEFNVDSKAEYSA